MRRHLRVAVAHEAPDTRNALGELLTGLGHQPMTVAGGRLLLDLCAAGTPDVIISDGGGLDAAREASARGEVPVILLAGALDADLPERAAAADNVMACLVEPVAAPDILAALTVTLSRFGQLRQARREAAELRQALVDRKLIERAKGAVMKRMGVSEEEAFARLRKYAADSHQKFVEAARRALEAEEVFHGLEAATRGGVTGQGGGAHDPRRMPVANSRHQPA
jgi:response regulator NasT